MKPLDRFNLLVEEFTTILVTLKLLRPDADYEDPYNWGWSIIYPPRSREEEDLVNQAIALIGDDKYEIFCPGVEGEDYFNSIRYRYRAHPLVYEKLSLMSPSGPRYLGETDWLAHLTSYVQNENHSTKI